MAILCPFALATSSCASTTQAHRLHARISAKNERLAPAVRRRDLSQPERIMFGANDPDEAPDRGVAYGGAAADNIDLLGYAGLTTVRIRRARRTNGFAAAWLIRPSKRRQSLFRADAEEFANALRGLEPEAGQHHHRHLIRTDRTVAQELRQRRAGSGGSRLDKEAKPAERGNRRRDLRFGDHDDTSSRSAQGAQYLGDADGLRSGDPVGDGRSCRERHQLILSCRPRGCEGRAISRLHCEEARSCDYLAAFFKLVEAALEAEDVAAISGRNEDVVGRAKAELLPQLEGERFGALDKEWLPIVAGVKAFADCRKGGLGHILPRAGDCPDIGARNGDLHELAARCRGWDIDAAGDARSRRVGRDRGSRIPRRILVDWPDADLDQVVDHDRRAAIFERSGRHLRFELEADFCPLPVAQDERRPALAERDARRTCQRQRCSVAP